MRSTVATEAVEAAAVFAELLAHRVGEARPENLDFDADGLWRELESGGWLGIGTELTAEASLAAKVLDLTAFAEVWGRHLVPLPFIEHAAAVLADSADVPGEPCPVLSDGTVVRTRGFGPASPAVVVSAEDHFAPSIPTQRDAGAGVGTLPFMFALWAAEAVGCASAALERTVEYVKVRQAYGRPVGTFQAVQHVLADCYRDVELGRSGVVACAVDWETSRGMAIHVVDRAVDVVNGAIQMHGGVGFTWELGIHLYLRHLVILRSLIRDAQLVETLLQVAPGTRDAP